LLRYDSLAHELIPGFGVALGSQWGAYRLAINMHWCGFDVALVWLWGGFAAFSSFILLPSPKVASPGLSKLDVGG
jgi:hypothetical protein